MTTTQRQALRRDVTTSLLDRVDRGEPLTIVKAPPGSGKTYNILQMLALTGYRQLRTAVAAQTNSQADDITRRLVADFPKLTVTRFLSKDGNFEGEIPKTLRIARSSTDLINQPGVVIATTDKWATSSIKWAFDWLIIDESWQMTFAAFKVLDKVAPRFVLVGDPGQIDPVVTIDTSRWATSWRRPTAPAPDAILEEPDLRSAVVELPLTTRLPYDSARLVRAFYDFEFEAWSEPGQRQLLLGPRRGKSAVDAAIESLQTGSLSLMTLATPAEGAPPEDDPALASAAIKAIRRLLARGARFNTENHSEPEALKPAQIGVVATHRVMVTRLREELGELGNEVRVDTPERWQGLERPLMIAVHPLSGQMRPSAFDLDTGRLNVMLSRHSVALLLVGRDHIGQTLAEYAPSADQPLGHDDQTGAGHSRNLAFWRRLEEEGRIIPCS